MLKSNTSGNKMFNNADKSISIRICMDWITSMVCAGLLKIRKCLKFSTLKPQRGGRGWLKINKLLKTVPYIFYLKPIGIKKNILLQKWS